MSGRTEERSSKPSKHVICVQSLYSLSPSLYPPALFRAPPSCSLRLRQWTREWTTHVVPLFCSHLHSFRSPSSLLYPSTPLHAPFILSSVLVPLHLSTAAFDDTLVLSYATPFVRLAVSPSPSSPLLSPSPSSPLACRPIHSLARLHASPFFYCPLLLSPFASFQSTTELTWSPYSSPTEPPSPTLVTLTYSTQCLCVRFGHLEHLHLRVLHPKSSTRDSVCRRSIVGESEHARIRRTHAIYVRGATRDEMTERGHLTRHTLGLYGVFVTVRRCTTNIVYTRYI